MVVILKNAQSSHQLTANDYIVSFFRTRLLEEEGMAEAVPTIVLFPLMLP